MLDKDTKRRIFADLLKQAPPGEFNAVFDDIRTMHHDAQILDEQCTTTLIEYNHDNFLPVTHPELQEVSDYIFDLFIDFFLFRRWSRNIIC